jgi:Fe(3+) dicitrate transport protein
LKRVLANGCLLVALAVVALPSVASAQAPQPAEPPAADSTPVAAPTADTTTPAPAQPRTEVAEVRVIGSSADALQRIPGSGTLVTAEDIKRADPFDVGEMLRRVPGVQARQEYGGGLRLDISVRGNEGGRSRRVLVLEDGVPLSLNPYAEPDMYYSPPIERMRGIEVVKGSGSILFGPQTIGGVVNFLTLLPEETQRASVDAEGGQYGYFRGMTTYNDYFGSARYVVQALYRRGDGIRDEAFSQVDVLAKMAVDTSRDGEAIFKIGFHNDSTQSDDVGLTRAMYAATPRRGTLAPNDHIDLRRYDASVVHDQRLGDNSSLKTLAYAYTTNRIWNRQAYVRQRASGETYEHIVGDEGIPFGAIYFQNSDVVLDRTYEVAGVEPRFQHRFSTLGVGHTMDFGARLLTETAHYQQRTGDTPTSISGSLDSEEKHRTYAEAAYVEDRMAFLSWLLVTPGLRIEHADFERQTLRQGGKDVDLSGDSSSTGVIPGVGIVAGTKRASVFGGIHVGWAPPRVTSSINPKGTTAQLSEERSVNYEIGTRTRPAPWLKAEATLFLSKFDNQVVLNTGTDTSQTAETDAGTTRHYGTELGSVVEFGRALGLGSILDLGLRYTFSRATFQGGPNAGNLLPYSPLHAFNGNLDFEHKSGFGGQIAYNVVSSQFTDVLNTRAEDTTGRVGEMPAYQILDLGAHYRHKPSRLTFRITVKNALDQVYISARRPEGIFTSGYRQALLGVRWDYEKKPEGQTQ